MRKLLLTGASGRIGRTFFEGASDRYEFLLADRRLPDYEIRAPHRFRQVDLSQRGSADELVRGMDTIVHLAAVPDIRAVFEDLLPNNILATTYLLAAAAASGCRRVVFASSGQTVEAYPVDRQITSQMTIKPANLYGVSKAYGEALCACYAGKGAFSAVAVRIGAFQPAEGGASRNARDMSMWLSPRDAVHLLRCAVEAEGFDFFIAHGVSNNRFKRLEISETRQVLGYKPQDDAFARFDLATQALWQRPGQDRAPEN